MQSAVWTVLWHGIFYEAVSEVKSILPFRDHEKGLLPIKLRAKPTHNKLFGWKSAVSTLIEQRRPAAVI